MSDNHIALLLSILTNGIVRGRFFADSGNARRAAIELDHIHNIPEIIKSRSVEHLGVFLSVDVKIFCEKVPANENLDFIPLWEQLRACPGID